MTMIVNQTDKTYRYFIDRKKVIRGLQTYLT